MDAAPLYSHPDVTRIKRKEPKSQTTITPSFGNQITGQNMTKDMDSGLNQCQHELNTKYTYINGVHMAYSVELSYISLFLGAKTD